MTDIKNKYRIMNKQEYSPRVKILCVKLDKYLCPKIWRKGVLSIFYTFCKN